MEYLLCESEDEKQAMAATGLELDRKHLADNCVAPLLGGLTVADGVDYTGIDEVCWVS